MTTRTAASVTRTMADDDRTGDAARRPDGSSAPSRPGGRDGAWGAPSYLVAGPLTLGLPGFGLDHLLGTAFLGPLGIVAGVALGAWYVWFRYGVDREPTDARPGTVHDDGAPAARTTAGPSSATGHPHPRSHDDVRAEETT